MLIVFVKTVKMMYLLKNNSIFKKNEEKLIKLEKVKTFKGYTDILV